jgi:hypothetical protein
LTNAFMKMSPEQQLDVMTGGRSGMGDARDALYLAQAEALRASADATGAWINGAGGVGAAVNGSPEAPAAVPAGSPALRSLGIADSDESDFDRIRSFVGPSGEIPPTARTKLQEWANEPLESEANGIWGRWFGMKNWPAIRVNNLKRKIRSGDWAGAAAMLKAPEAGTPGAPDYLPPAPSSPV